VIAFLTTKRNISVSPEVFMMMKRKSNTKFGLLTVINLWTAILTSLKTTRMRISLNTYDKHLMMNNVGFQRQKVFILMTILIVLINLMKNNFLQKKHYIQSYMIVTSQMKTTNTLKRFGNVRKRFDMQTMRDYHNLYLKTDVLLLSDVFEGFRTVCLENYDLDPCWYYIAPGSTFDALLKESKVQLELFQATQICC